MVKNGQNVGGFDGVWQKGVKMSHISDDREHENTQKSGHRGRMAIILCKNGGTMTPVSLK